MPKLKALHTLALESKRVRTGETFSVKNIEQAAALVASGAAEEVAKSAPAAADKAAAEAQDQSTQKEDKGAVGSQTKEEKEAVKTKDAK